MKKMKNSLDELKATLERIRKEKYPSIPTSVIDEIVEVQMANQDNPAKRQAETIKVIDHFAALIKSEESGDVK